MLRLASCHAGTDPQGGDSVNSGLNLMGRLSQYQQPVESNHHGVNFLNLRRTSPLTRIAFLNSESIHHLASRL